MTKIQSDALPASPTLSEAQDRFLMAEYSALRAEIIARTTIQHTLIQIALVAVAAILGFGLEQKSATAILLYPILAMLLAAAWKQSNLRIGQIGMYTKDKIESALGGNMGWEHYLETHPDYFSTFAPGGIFITTQVVAILVCMPLLEELHFPAPSTFLGVLDVGIVALTAVILRWGNISLHWRKG